MKAATALLTCCLVISLPRIFGQDNVYFLGGSISASLSDTPSGDYLVSVDLLTNWVLGHGPCGPGCSRNDIGRSTNTTRNQVIYNKGNPTHFGSFMLEYRDSKHNTEQLDTFINFTEVVTDVNEVLQYEREHLTFSFTSTAHDVQYFDVIFHGCCWRNLTLLGEFQHWHIQTKIRTGNRSDSERYNQLPFSFPSPLYRVPTNALTTITISAMDDDDDFVRCDMGLYAESEPLRENTFPGVSFDPDTCSVHVNTSSPTYHNGDWVAIPLTVRDLPTSDIDYYDVGQLRKYGYSLSGSGTQFVVHVVDDPSGPGFIHNEYAHNHEFYIFTSCTWIIHLTVRAPPHRTIASCSALGQGHEAINLTYSGQQSSNVVRMAAEWSPGLDDAGHRIICFTCLDDTGMETTEQICYRLHVHPKTYQQYKVGNTFLDGMEFTEIPSDVNLTCPTGATCLVPIFLRSTVPLLAKSAVTVNISYIDQAAIENVKSLGTHMGVESFLITLSVTHNIGYTTEQICLLASSTTGASMTYCLDARFIGPDPCISTPCKNSGSCITDDTGHFSCKCMEYFDGQYCEQKTDFCDPNPCSQGQCYALTLKAYCYCKDTGYTGQFCEINIDDCENVNCNTGECVDGIRDYTCNCSERYSGPSCEIDKCPWSINPDKCEMEDHCQSIQCMYGGECINSATSYKCTCPIGTTGQRCEVNGTICVEGSGLTNGELWTKVTTCSKGEVCYSERLQSISGEHSFVFGCRDANTCSANNATHCVECCTQDYCNVDGCSATGLPASDQRGPVCFDCDDMSNMDFCDRVTVCGKDERCVVYGSKYTKYDSKCYNKQHPCDVLGTPYFIGEGQKCERCCDTDFCNRHCDTPETKVFIIG